MTAPSERGPRAPGPSRRRALQAGLGLWLRMVRAEPPLVLAVAGMLFLAAVLVAGGARLFDRVSTDDVRRATTDGLPEDRSLAIETDTRIGAGPEGDRFQIIDRRGQTYLDGLPSEIADVLGPRQFLVESPPFRVGSYPDEDDGPFVLSFRFRHQQGVEDHLTIIAGRPPGPAEPIPILLGSDCPPDREAVDGFEVDPTLDCRAAEVPVLEVALTEQTASDLLIEVGQRLILRPDPVHPDWRFVFGSGLEARIVIEVAGIIELSEQSDPFWYGDPSLHRSRVFENPDIRIVDAAGIIDPDQYGRLLRTNLDPPFHYTWRFPVDPERLDTDRIEPLLAELDKLERPGARIVTRLPATLGNHLDQRTLSASLLSTVFAGVVGVTAAAVWVLTELGVARQERSWRLILERGAGRGQVVAMGLVHGLAIAVPAALAGWVVARLAVADGSPWIGAAPAVALAVGSVLASLGATATTIVAGTGTRGRLIGERAPSARAGTLARARTIVRDGVIVIAAVGAVLLVRRRAGGGVLSADGGTDRLLAVTPIVVGAGLAVLLLRLAPPLLRLLAAGPGRGRGSVGFLGLRRLVDDRRTARATIVVVLLAIGLAGFGVSLRTSMTRAQEAQIWQAVGAEHELTSSIRPGMTIDEELTDRLAALAPAAMGAEFPGAELRSLTAAGTVEETSDPFRADVLAVETEPLAAIVAEAPDAPTASLDRIGTERVEAAAPLPALVAGRWPDGTRPGSGDRVRARLDGLLVELSVTEVLDRFPGLDPDRPSVVVDLVALRARADGPVPTTVVRLGPADRVDLTTAVESDGTLRLRSRSELTRVVADDPLTALVAQGLAWLGWFGVLAAAGASLAGLGLTAPARRRDLRLLATLGFRGRQASAMTVIEQVAPIALAAGAGALLATVLVTVVGPVLDIGTFAGDFATAAGSRLLVPVSVQLDGRAIAVVVGLLALFTAVAAAVTARRDRRRGLRTIVDEGGSR